MATRSAAARRRASSMLPDRREATGLREALVDIGQVGTRVGDDEAFELVAVKEPLLEAVAKNSPRLREADADDGLHGFVHTWNRERVRRCIVRTKERDDVPNRNERESMNDRVLACVH